MKKSLIALAVIAASGAAMAQSSVTLYGLVDMYVGSVKTGNGTTSLRQTKVESGLVNTSRFGLKGTEDLGNGLAANFVLEQGIAADTGAAKTATLLVAPAAGTSFAFSRQAWVGLSGSFGSTRIGLTPTPFDDVSGQYDAVFDSGLSPMNSVFASANSYLVRPGNTIAYYTPNLSGFSASASYSLGENKTAAVNAGSVYSLALAYANGPIGVSLGYQNEKVDSSALARKYVRLGGSYDFGAAKLYANYGRAENYEFSSKATLSGAKASDYQVGVDVPVGAALTLSASYAQSKDNATAGNDKRKGFGLGAKYALSKRTALYGGYEADNSKVSGTTTLKHDLFAVGVQHRF
ncbi:porin [Rhodoferax sp. WC2427]|uniref:porin n=1 Tax=Rhodoferax sp. WC2427 TaxID=3234144 RepID=UPI003467939B